MNGTNSEKRDIKRRRNTTHQQWVRYAQCTLISRNKFCSKRNKNRNCWPTQIKMRDGEREREGDGWKDKQSEKSNKHKIPKICYYITCNNSVLCVYVCAQRPPLLRHSQINATR